MVQFLWSTLCTVVGGLRARAASRPGIALLADVTAKTDSGPACIVQVHDLSVLPCLFSKWLERWSPDCLVCSGQVNKCRVPDDHERVEVRIQCRGQKTRYWNLIFMAKDILQDLGPLFKMKACLGCSSWTL